MRAISLLIALAFGIATTFAQSPLPPPALLEALHRAPPLDAARLKIDAARLRTESAGRLADVEVEGMGSRMVGPMDERATMWEVNVRQPLPKRGERAADRERALAGVAAAEADYATTAGEIAADAAAALAEAEGTEARIKLLEAQLGRFDSLLKSVTARLSTGTARLVDRLAVQGRMSALELTLDRERRAAADARAEARARLGLAADSALPSFAAPNPAEIVVDDTAALRLAAARSAEATAQTKIARASANPMTAVGLRFERERTRMGDENTVGLAFMSDLPFRSRRYARTDTRAAEADRAAAQAEGSAARFRIANALQRVERAERVAATARRLGAETESRLGAEHELLSRSFSVGTGGSMGGESAVFHAVDILEKSTETQLQIVEAETAARLARAELWRYAPATQLLRGIHR